MGKIRQKRTKLAKKVLRTPNPKSKILFSILTLARNHFIKVLLEKNSYLQSFWEFGSFPFFVKFNGKRCRYPRKHPPLESHRHLFSLKTIWKHLKDTFGIPKSYRDKSLVQVGSFTQICLYYRYLFFIVKMRERFKI